MSREFQEEKALEYCKYRGFDVLETFEDRALSDRNYAKRPGLCAAMANVCKVHGVLVVYNLARLTRSIRDTVRMSGHIHDKPRR